MFTACLSPIVSPAVHHGGGPAGPHYHVVDLVPGSSVVGEPRNKVALWVFEASAGNHKAVHRREIYQAVTINAPRANCKLAQDMPCCRIHGTRPCVPVPYDNQHISCGMLAATCLCTCAIDRSSRAGYRSTLLLTSLANTCAGQSERHVPPAPIRTPEWSTRKRLKVNSIYTATGHA